MSKRMFGAVAILAAACLGGGLWRLHALRWPASEQPTDGQLGLQLPASPIMDSSPSLFHIVNIIITIIVLFVLALMVWVMYRFSEKNNPTPSRTTHQHLPRSCLDDRPDPDPRRHLDPVLSSALQSVRVPEARSDDQSHGQRVVLGA